jgi:hypothetical protein
VGLLFNYSIPSHASNPPQTIVPLEYKNVNLNEHAGD